MRALQVAFHAFGTELASVEGELVPGFKADDFVVFDFELDAALLAAKTAVGLNEFVRLDAGIEPRADGNGQMRAVVLIDVFGGSR